jgi:hypothetical protein
MGKLGEVAGADGLGAPEPRLIVTGLDGSVVIDAGVSELKEAWQQPLRW